MNLTYKFPSSYTSELKEISLCEKAHFSDACSYATLSALISSGAVAVAAYDTDKLCGFGYISIAPGEAELLRIAVNPEMRGKGIAKSILSLLHKKAKELGCEEIFLEVRESNIKAIRLYESDGYIKIGTRRGFYKDPKEDAILYKKNLKG